MGRKKKIDLNTAITVDAALPSPVSVYDIVGYKTSPYRTSNYEEYQAHIRKMNLIDLHSHAWDVAVTPIENRTALIDRLERKFLEGVSKYNAVQDASNNKRFNGKVSEKAQAILNRGK